MFNILRRSRDRVWPRFAPWVQRAPAFDITDANNYCHFNEGVLADDGAGVISYINGDNHGQRDDYAVVVGQKLDASGNFVLDGSEVSAGVATFSTGRFPFIYSTDDESTKTFTVTGTFQGSPQVVSVTGPQRSDPSGAYYKRRYLTVKYDTITAVSVDGATTGEVSVGVKEGPSDYCSARISGGIVTTQVISEGRQSGRRHYWSSMGKHQSGTLVAPYTNWEDDTSLGKNRIMRSTDHGKTFQGGEEILFYGMGSYTTPFTLYTSPLPVPGHATDMVNIVQRSGASFWGRSSDMCGSFTGAQFINCPSITFTNVETIDQGAKRIGLVSSAGNLASQYAAGDMIGWSSGGNNNNVYSVNSASYGVDPADGMTRTMVVVNETIASSLVAGRLRSISVSEHALEMYDANNWVVIGRINGVVAPMYAWTTSDAGATWTHHGRLGLQRSGGWASPQVTLARREDGVWIVLWIMARDASSGTPPNNGNLVAYACKYDAFMADPTKLGSGPPFVIGYQADATQGRSGYPAVMIDPASLVGMVAWGTEVGAPDKSKLWWQYVNLNTYLDSLA